MLRDRRALPGIVLSAALAVLVPPAHAQDAEALLKRAAGAMGAGELKSLRYAAEGTGYSFGQAFEPGMAWPKITVHSQARTINYDTGSMREEITLSRAEPKGGGGYPLSGQQRNDQYVSGGHAWNVAANGNALPGPRFVVDRTHQLWITPHGVVKAAMKNKAKVQFTTQGGKSLAAVSFTEPGRFAATAYLNDAYLVERVESRVPDPVLGEVAVVTTYSDYRDSGGVRFPGRIQQSQAGHAVLDVTVKEFQANAAADIAVPDAVKSATERVTTEKVADGVWFVAGGSHNSVAIEMKDHLVLVEAPLNDGRTLPVIEAVRKLAPGKPIRFVINSHNHFDHSGGLRAAVAEGATVVTHAANRPYFQKAFAVASKVSPDRLAQSGKKPKFVEVKDKLAMSDGTRTLDILRLTGGVHTGTFLMVHLPKERLLIEADAYTPLAPNAPPPATPNANNVNLIENIERLKLGVDRILPLHGRVVPASELYATARRAAP
jgi:glyoxylase-like metal-dependent hydrolase (beta-lactamase superfamily II)